MIESDYSETYGTTFTPVQRKYHRAALDPRSAIGLLGLNANHRKMP